MTGNTSPFFPGTFNTINLANLMMNKLPIFILMTLSLVSVALTSVLLTNRALADNPSTCVNLYDATIKSLKINVGSRTIDPIANPNTNFAAVLGQGYTVTLTLHSASLSDSGNTNVGSVWYGSTAYGFASDHCVNGASPNTDITITLTNVFMGQATHGTVQLVEWYTWPLTQPSDTYTVHWH
jgi:hypothetical protein